MVTVLGDLAQIPPTIKFINFFSFPTLFFATDNGISIITRVGAVPLPFVQTVLDGVTQEGQS